MFMLDAGASADNLLGSSHGIFGRAVSSLRSRPLKPEKAKRSTFL